MEHAFHRDLVITHANVIKDFRAITVKFVEFFSNSLLFWDDYFSIKYFKVNNCKTDPCVNNGTCVSIDSVTVGCLCPAGFSGSTCQFRNRCFSNPCKNNASCQSAADEYICNCQIGFSGKNCETYKTFKKFKCLQSSCLNGGVCSINRHSNLTECQCPPLYSGADKKTLFNILNLI